jgi:ParB-like chromosome segregation protein Spo0J
MVGLIELPCIVKEVDDYNRFLMQFIANLQREDIQPLEEAAGIRQLVETYGYNQSKVAKLLNKSKSYVSQVLGLDRLEEPAREIIRNTSVPKEAQIQASRETDPSKQRDILIEASKDGSTIRQLRKGRELQKRKGQKGKNVAAGKEDPSANRAELFIEWTWESPDKAFTVSIKFMSAQNKANRTYLCKKALNEALVSMDKENAPLFPSPPHSNRNDVFPDNATHE